jgi:hypothetical protein
MQPVSVQMPPDVLERHAYAVDVSGYTILPAQVGAAELDELRLCADRALAATRAAVRVGQKLKHTYTTEYYEAVRCLYCWGEACVRLLEHDTVHALAALLMGRYRLWDLSVLAALPAPPTASAATTSWHRDYRHVVSGTPLPGHLWFFLCLDDVTSDNGATWVVPGSHRIASTHEPAPGKAWSGDSLDAYPSRIQLCGRAGDIVVIDPLLMHSSGRNNTARARRLLNIGLVHADLQPLLDHWAVAGPATQEGASERVRMMLGADRAPLDTTWTVLPEGWQTAGSKTQGATS